MCQHCSVWEVAPGGLCLTHKGEIQLLFQRKSSSYISTALGKQNNLTRGPWSCGCLSPWGGKECERFTHFDDRNPIRMCQNWRKRDQYLNIIKWLVWHVFTSPWHKITIMCLLKGDKVTDSCQRFSDYFIRWDLRLSCSLWKKKILSTHWNFKTHWQDPPIQGKVTLMRLMHILFLSNTLLHTYTHSHLGAT